MVEYQETKEDVLLLIREKIGRLVRLFSVVDLLLFIQIGVCLFIGIRNQNIGLYVLAGAGVLVVVFSLIMYFRCSSNIKKGRLLFFEQGCQDGVAKYILQEKEDQLILLQKKDDKKIIIRKSDIKAIVYYKKGVQVYLSRGKEVFVIKNDNTEAFFRRNDPQNRKRIFFI